MAQEQVRSILLTSEDYDRYIESLIRFKTWEKSNEDSLKVIEDLKKEVSNLKQELQQVDSKRINNYNMYLACRRKIDQQRAMIKGGLYRAVLNGTR